MLGFRSQNRPAAILIFAFFLGVTLLNSKNVKAESSMAGRSLGHLYGGATSSFYDPTTESFQWIGPVFVGTTLLASYLSYEFLDQASQPGRSNQNWESFGAGLSKTTTFLPYAMPVSFFIAAQFMDRDHHARSKTLETAEMMAESLALTLASTYALKASVNRERPNGQGYSFPSGHTSLNFAMAGVLAMQYPWYVGVPALAMASSVGFARVDGQSHYLSDVVIGAGIGLFFSTSVYLYHSQAEKHVSLESEGTSLIPLIGDDTYGISLASVF